MADRTTVRYGSSVCLNEDRIKKSLPKISHLLRAFVCVRESLRESSILHCS